MDYTPGGFHNATRQEFKIQNTGPQVMTTRAQQLAMYIVYESPFACVSDSPDAYRGQAGAEFLKVVPTSWDETRVLAGEIGEYIVIARRHGQEWYVGAMTNEQQRVITIPLDFLGDATYQLSGFADGAKPTDVRRLIEVVTARKLLTTGTRNGKDHFTVHLAPGGGFALRFTPTTK
jgi:alpha-glucosidase